MPRTFRTFFTPEQLATYQRGIFDYRYRDTLCLKSPIDIALYLALLAEARPRTLFEIGSKHGGSAMLLRDFTRALELDCAIVSIDITPPDLTADGIRFLAGNVLDLGEVFTRDDLFSYPRPWLVIEDSAHSFSGCAAALRFCAEHLAPGEWLAMEDGVLEDLGLAERYDGGPNRAIGEFLADHPDIFEIGTRYCDMFGTNATYNPNGYLRRTARSFGR